jgi:hypothetical protein
MNIIAQTEGWKRKNSQAKDNCNKNQKIQLSLAIISSGSIANSK